MTSINPIGLVIIDKIGKNILFKRLMCEDLYLAYIKKEHESCDDWIDIKETT